MHSALLLLWALGNTKIASLVLNLPPALTAPTISPPVLSLSNASSLTPSMLINLTQSIPALTSISYDCDKENFGSPSFDSCTNAYEQMAPGPHARSYGDRENQQTYDFPLPLRYASADGTCIIEVFPTIQGASDLLKPLNLKQAVRYLIQKCVVGEDPKGGIAEKLGQAKRISVFLQRYKPNVDCFEAEGHPPFDRQCVLDLNAMPVLYDEQIFGWKNTPGIDVALPVRFADSTGQCAIDVMIDGPPVRANWHDIWGAAVMVVALCARIGKSGVSSGTAGESELAVRVMNNAAGTLPDVAAKVGP